MKNIKKIVSIILPDGRMIETVLDPVTGQTNFAVWENGKIKIINKLKDQNGQLLYPISASNTLLKSKLISFSSEPVRYENIDILLFEIQNFIHRYVDLSEEFEKIASYYILLSWVYDRFTEIPYLRKIGDFGSGKTRFLKVLGAICYKGVFASGGTSTAAIFHIIDKFQGTLIIDEADFIFSDEKSAVAKILNNGNASGFPILRVSQKNNGQFTPISYTVFCPKIIASRKNYTDQALESRFITETFRPTKIRNNIPITLPDAFEEESLRLRNNLLTYRFKMFNKIKKYIIPDNIPLEGRISQIFSPLLSVVFKQEDREHILEIASQYSNELKNDRSQNIEAQVLSIIKQLQNEKQILSIKNITNEF
ncbi:hypothetical protein HN928_03535, partial [bacterium]|nr:hypothetical protein [bacterium]